MKNYLITGGAGFLGSNLALRLLREGNSVTAVDNLMTGLEENLVILKKENNFEFINQDIVKSLEINKKYDFVINLACPASPPKYYKDPIHTLRTSAIGTQNVLDFALKNQARFFHASTSEIYGDPLEHPQRESYFGNVDPYCKRSCYDEGKRYAEALIYEYRHERQLNTGLIRIFNTYGPMMDPSDGRVVTNFILQALRGENLTVQGDGRQTRSFCYVDDQIEGMIRMIHSSEEGPINIGNPEEYQVIDLARLVIELTGSKSKIVHTEAALSDPKKRQPDINIAKNKLGWQPKVSVREGLQKTIDWFRKMGD